MCLQIKKKHLACTPGRNLNKKTLIVPGYLTQADKIQRTARFFVFANKRVYLRVHTRSASYANCCLLIICGPFVFRHID